MSMEHVRSCSLVWAGQTYLHVLASHGLATCCVCLALLEGLVPLGHNGVLLRMLSASCCTWQASCRHAQICVCPVHVAHLGGLLSRSRLALMGDPLKGVGQALHAPPPQQQSWRQSLQAASSAAAVVANREPACCPWVLAGMWSELNCQMRRQDHAGQGIVADEVQPEAWGTRKSVLSGVRRSAERPLHGGQAHSHSCLANSRCARWSWWSGS